MSVRQQNVSVGDYLTLIGELAIGVAGFAGVVAALSRRAAGDWRPVDVVRLQMLLRISIGCALWAVFPAFLLAGGLLNETLWRITSGLWLLYIALSAGTMLHRIRVVFAENRADASLSLSVLVGAGMLVTASLQAANAVLLGQAWPHLFALAWGLCVAALLFLRLALLAFRSESVA
jgi:hypothetical protein